MLMQEGRCRELECTAAGVDLAAVAADAAEVRLPCFLACCW